MSRVQLSLVVLYGCLAIVTAIRIHDHGRVNVGAFGRLSQSLDQSIELGPPTPSSDGSDVVVGQTDWLMVVECCTRHSRPRPTDCPTSPFCDDIPSILLTALEEAAKRPIDTTDNVFEDGTPPTKELTQDEMMQAFIRMAEERTNTDSSTSTSSSISSGSSSTSSASPPSLIVSTPSSTASASASSLSKMSQLLKPSKGRIMGGFVELGSSTRSAASASDGTSTPAVPDRQWPHKRVVYRWNELFDGVKERLAAHEAKGRKGVKLIPTALAEAKIFAQVIDDYHRAIRHWTIGTFGFSPCVRFVLASQLPSSTTEPPATHAVEFLIQLVPDPVTQRLHGSTSFSDDVNQPLAVSVHLPPSHARTRTAVHELGHVLGFKHTQSRVDRDDFIRVQLTTPMCAAKHRQYDIVFDGKLYTPYDFESIMHYRYGECIERRMPATHPTTVQPGTSLTLSSYDVIALRQMYQCGVPVTASGVAPVEARGGKRKATSSSASSISPGTTKKQMVASSSSSSSSSSGGNGGGSLPVASVLIGSPCTSTDTGAWSVTRYYDPAWTWNQVRTDLQSYLPFAQSRGDFVDSVNMANAVTKDMAIFTKGMSGPTTAPWTHRIRGMSKDGGPVSIVFRQPLLPSGSAVASSSSSSSSGTPIAITPTLSPISSSSSSSSSSSTTTTITATSVSTTTSVPKRKPIPRKQTVTAPRAAPKQVPLFSSSTSSSSSSPSTLSLSLGPDSGKMGSVQVSSLLTPPLTITTPLAPMTLLSAPQPLVPVPGRGSTTTGVTVPPSGGSGPGREGGPRGVVRPSTTVPSTTTAPPFMTKQLRINRPTTTVTPPTPLVTIPPPPPPAVTVPTAPLTLVGRTSSTTPPDWTILHNCPEDWSWSQVKTFVLTRLQELGWRRGKAQGWTEGTIRIGGIPLTRMDDAIGTGPRTIEFWQ